MAITPGEKRSLELVLATGGQVSGTVARPDGRPAPGAIVHAFTKVGTDGLPWHSIGAAVAGPDGRYEFDSVPDGTYTVVASARDLTNSATSNVVVTAGNVATVNFSMLLSSGAAIGAPTSLVANAFTYPDNAAATQARIRSAAEAT